MSFKRTLESHIAQIQDGALICSAAQLFVLEPAPDLSIRWRRFAVVEQGSEKQGPTQGHRPSGSIPVLINRAHCICSLLGEAWKVVVEAMPWLAPTELPRASTQRVLLRWLIVIEQPDQLLPLSSGKVKPIAVS